MALQYSSSNGASSDAKLQMRSFSNSVQKTPFSIEDILNQKNNTANSELAYSKDTPLIRKSDFVLSAKGTSGESGEPKKVATEEQHKQQQIIQKSPHGHLFNGNNHPGSYNMYPAYSDGYLHMIAPYLASTATGYKSVDPYFLSQGG